MKATTRLALTTIVAMAALVTGACAPGAEDGDMTDRLDQASSAEERAPEPPATVVPAGTQLTFVIDETLSTDDSSAGQMFNAHVANEVLASDGSTLLPAGTAARGMIVEASESTGSDEPATLIIRLETVELDGAMTPIEGTVVSAEIDASARDTRAETAGKIAIGAAAGAIIGQIIGKDTESTLAGAGAGAVAGTVVALTTRDGHATLPRGSTVVVRLDQPLTGN